MKNKLKHGQMGTGNWSHCRWCDTHSQYHAVLYNCEEYPLGVRQVIESESKSFKKNLQNSKWVEQQIKNGVPSEVISIMKTFSGVEND